MRNVFKSIVAIAAILALAPAALAAAPTDHQVFTDPVDDEGLTAPDWTPPFRDLVAGYISETADEISFTWELADLPDSPAYMPFATYYWEFSLNESFDGYVPCSSDGSSDASGECYSLRASIDNTGQPVGSVEGNCTTTGNLIECEVLEGITVTVTVDSAANQITASVPRDGLRDYSDGGENVLAVDGMVLVEEDLFNGIAAHTTLGVSCTCEADTADLTEGFYTLGTNT